MLTRDPETIHCVLPKHCNYYHAHTALRIRQPSLSFVTCPKYAEPVFVQLLQCVWSSRLVFCLLRVFLWTSIMHMHSERLQAMILYPDVFSWLRYVQLRSRRRHPIIEPNYFGFCTLVIDNDKLKLISFREESLSLPKIIAQTLSQYILWCQLYRNSVFINSSRYICRRYKLMIGKYWL